MFRHLWMSLLSAGGIGLLVLPSLPARDNTTEEPAAAVEVQARGPLHEAFAQPVEGRPQPGPVVAKEPPAALDEVAPDQKPDGADVRWITGYWQWDEERNDYIWVSGFWRATPPGRQWVPGAFRHVEGGWQWVPGFWADAGQDEIVYQPPPPPLPDAGPSTPPPDETSSFVTGCWLYQETHYRWRPGFWLAHRPGWVWQPDHYAWSPAGCVFVNGYWDYPLADRGLCFAPVYVPPALCQQPGFSYCPSYVVSADFLPGALFVHGGGCGHYYFGDYFGRRYERDYTPFVDCRIGRSACDPLFDYYRHDRGVSWERQTRAIYTDRSSGHEARPPRTLVQQNTLIENIQVNKTVNVTSVTNVRSVTVVQPLARAATPQRPLTTLGGTERALVRQEAVQVARVGQSRHAQEARLVSTGSAPLRASDPPRAVQLALPKPTELQGSRPAPAPPAKPGLGIHSTGHTGLAIVRTGSATVPPRHPEQEKAPSNAEKMTLPQKPVLTSPTRQPAVPPSPPVTAAPKAPANISTPHPQAASPSPKAPVVTAPPKPLPVTAPLRAPTITPPSSPQATTRPPMSPAVTVPPRQQAAPTPPRAPVITAAPKPLAVTAPPKAPMIPPPSSPQAATRPPVSPAVTTPPTKAPPKPASQPSK